MTDFPWYIGVVVPARNEEELLPRCLQSILTAKTNLSKHAGNQAACDIVVMADSSTDRTVEIARRILRAKGRVRSIRAGAVGAARRAATRSILQRYQGPLHKCWFANTDADCVVPPHWLIQQLEFAKADVQALAGIISVDHFGEHGAEVPNRFRSSYRIHADGSHPHVHGANLGFRADAYIRAGGWNRLTTAEDHDLWQRLSLAGARLCSSSSVVVETSGRRTGRAPNGFADALAAHNETAA